MQALDENAVTNLAAYAWALVKAKGNQLQAVEVAKHYLGRTHPRVEDVTRAAVEGHALADLAEYRQVAASFVGSLPAISAYDTVLPFALRVPLRTRMSAVLATMTGSNPAEGGMKPLSSFALGDEGIEPQKATAFIVLSDEVLRFAASVGIDFFNSELRIGVAAATNRAWLASLTDGVGTTGSLGDPLPDLAAGLLAVASARRGFRPYWIVDFATAIALASRQTDDGAQVFPQMTPTGGVIAGVPVLVSDEVGADSNGALSFIVDAAGLAMADEPVVIRFSRQADVVLDDEPSEGAQSVTSLFQTDSAALLAERYFGSRRLRDSAVHVISGADYSEAT